MDFIELDGYQFESDCELHGYQYESDCESDGYQDDCELDDVNLHQNGQIVFFIKIQCRDFEGNIVYHDLWSPENELSRCPINESEHTVVSSHILRCIKSNYDPVESNFFIKSIYI